MKEPVKVGIVCECGPQGAEVQVFPELVRRFAPDVLLDCVALGNLPKLIRDCGKATRDLLERGCRRVVIAWDLFPAWREQGIQPCRRDHRQGVFGALRAENVLLPQVSVVCIREELEAWLMADGRAISAVLSTPEHPRNVGHAKRPETLRKPKTRLTRLFHEHIHRIYSDRTDAVRIARALPDLTRLERIPAFIRFRQKVIGIVGEDDAVIVETAQSMGATGAIRAIVVGSLRITAMQVFVSSR